MNIPYVNLAAQHESFKEELLTAVSSVIDHGQFILGDEVREFEKKLCFVKMKIFENSEIFEII